MGSEHVEFRFEGEEAQAGAEALAGFLKDELPDWPTSIAEREEAGVRTRTLGAETLAAITLLLAIPPAVLATWDLAERMKFKQKVDRLIRWARERRERGEPIPVVLLPPKNDVVPLDLMHPDMMLDTITVQADAPPRNEP